MLCQLGVHALQADGVGHVAHAETRLVQYGDDAFMGLLHQVQDDLVVEVVDLGTQRKGERNGLTLRVTGLISMMLANGQIVRVLVHLCVCVCDR